MTKGIHRISNEEYHAEKEHLSSSNLKLLLKDPADFYEQKILGHKNSRTSPNREEGSLVHAMLLEPHVIDQEFAFFPGWTKRGKEYNEFKAENAGKIMISLPQKDRCDKYVAAAKRNPLAMELLSSGESELSLFGSLSGVPTKVRFDKSSEAKGQIVDIKTSAYPVDIDSFKQTVEHWGYHISAAMYLEMAEDYWQKPFEFYFIAIGKQDCECEVYKLSQETRFKGMVQINKALKLFKQCKESGEWIKSDSGKKEQKTDYEILEV